MDKETFDILPLVLITWVDSHYVPGWHTDEPSETPLLCRSVGWLLYDGDKAKTIAAHITDEETPQRCGEMTIPSGAILSMKVLQQAQGEPVLPRPDADSKQVRVGKKNPV